MVVVGILASWQQAIAQWGVPPDGTAAAWPRVGGQEPEPAVLSPQLSPIAYAPPRESFDNGRPQLKPDQPSWEACFELTYMKPRFEDGAEEDWRGNVLDFRLSPGPRLWITRTWPGGAAVRTRYWQFDHTTPTMWVVQVPFDSYVVFAQLEAHTVDFELAQKLEFHEWSLLMAAGARYAMMQHTIGALDLPDRWFKRFHAAGPTFALEGKRATCLPGFFLFGNFRGSLLSGVSRWSNGIETRDTDDISSIFEMQIGVEFDWHFSRRGVLFLRSGWEQQVWLGTGTFFDTTGGAAVETIPVARDDHDVGFMGFFVSVGANW